MCELVVNRSQDHNSCLRELLLQLARINVYLGRPLKACIHAVMQLLFILLFQTKLSKQWLPFPVLPPMLTGSYMYKYAENLVFERFKIPKK